jgi:preflagellin peptidase FlaK
VVDASLPDLLRLVAVPALAWAAVRDVSTRRVPNSLWGPLAFLGMLLLLWDGFAALGRPGAFTPFAGRTAVSRVLFFSLA